MGEVTIGKQRFVVEPFRYDKSLMVLAIATKLIDKCDLAKATNLAIAARDRNIVPELIRLVPNVLETARPLLLRGLAITLIPDKELVKFLDNEDELEKRIVELEELIRLNCGLDEVMELATIALNAMGSKRITQLLSSTVGNVGSVTNCVD